MNKDAKRKEDKPAVKIHLEMYLKTPCGIKLRNLSTAIILFLESQKSLDMFVMLKRKLLCILVLFNKIKEKLASIS